MKAINCITLVLITSVFTLNSFAQESDDSGGSVVEDSEMYIEEIRKTCETEASGLPEAEAYIRECIDSMKKSFAVQQD